MVAGGQARVRFFDLRFVPPRLNNGNLLGMENSLAESLNEGDPTLSTHASHCLGEISGGEVALLYDDAGTDRAVLNP